MSRGPQRKTTEQFVQDARKVHGDRYEYSLTAYEGARRKVSIVCFTHGVFLQEASSHLSGKGCPSCWQGREGDRRRSNTIEFVKKAKAVHGDKYDYSYAEYHTNVEKVRIICPVHGEFIQSPHHHSTGYGCPRCGHKKRWDNRRLNTDKFVAKAKEVHGGRYDYSSTEYLGYKEQLIVICRVHGKFQQKAEKHLIGANCSKCVQQARGDALRSSAEKFIRKAREIHGNRYDYSNAIYHKSNQKIVIVCPEHGKFLQVPGSHLAGNGCPACSESHGEKKITAFLKARGIKHRKQKRFSSCRSKRPLPFDFYLPQNRFLIEFQGQQHFFPVDFCSKGKAHAKKALRELKKRDCIKKNWAKNNSYELIKIRYDENVGEVLTDRLGINLEKAA